MLLLYAGRQESRANRSLWWSLSLRAQAGLERFREARLPRPETLRARGEVNASRFRSALTSGKRASNAASEDCGGLEANQLRCERQAHQDQGVTVPALM